MNTAGAQGADFDARELLFAEAPWYAELSEDKPETWGAWRVTKSSEDAWWKHILQVAALFAAEHNLVSAYRGRLAGISIGDLTIERAQREGRRSTDPIWDIANELIVGCYLERVMGWTFVEHEPQGHATCRGDWQFAARSGRQIFVEVKSLHEPERVTTGVYSRPSYTRRIRTVLKEAYRQLPDDGRATLIVLVGWGQLLGIPFGIVHGDVFQSLFGQMQITFQVMPYSGDSVRMGPSFRDMFVQGSKHRRLGVVAGMVVSGMDTPGIGFYAIHNPFANTGCRLATSDVEPATQVFVDQQGFAQVQTGITAREVWGRMSGDGD